MNRRQFLSQSASGVAALMVAPRLSAESGPGGQESSASQFPARIGKYYEAEAPATLDLAERARLGINHFTSIISVKEDYELLWNARFEESNPPVMHYQLSPLFACQGKAMEVLAYLRTMTGSRQNLDLEEKMVRMLSSHVGGEGIFWVPKTDGRKPWLGPEEYRPFAHVHGQGDIMHAMIAWYQYTGDPSWKELVDRMVGGVGSLMIVHKDDHAYFPTQGWMPVEYLRSCYVKSRGWKDTSEPLGEKGGEEGSLFVHQGRIAEALANWYLVSGNEAALKLSGELVRFYIQPKFWADWSKGDYPGVVGAEHAHWQGHYHGYVGILQGVLRYAVATDDARLKAFVRDGYEWTRQAWLARIGFVGDGQGCGCGRLIKLAIMLTDAGVGDYWEDTDLYIRNHGTEMQFTPEDIPYLRKVGEGRPPPQTTPFPFLTGPIELDVTGEKVIQASMGAFGQDPLKANWYGCCSPWGNMGIYFAWDAALRHEDGVVRVNLLLNRASPWMDVDSHLPYEGRVVFRNKTAKELFVRIPIYAQMKDVVCQVGKRRVDPEWFQRYLRLRHLKPGEVITIEFPEQERTEQWTTEATQREYKDFPGHATRDYKFRGNTLVEISPNWPGVFQPEWHLYASRKEKYQSGKAPIEKLTRFTTPMKFKWT